MQEIPAPVKRAYVLDVRGDGDHRLYDYSDINELARNFAMPHVAPIDVLWELYGDLTADDDDANELATHMPDVARTVWSAYVRVRAALMHTRRAHVTMTAAQRVALDALFVSTVRARVMVARLRRRRAHLATAGARESAAFAYPEAVRASAGVAIDIPGVRVEAFTLEQLRTAFDGLADAFERCGATLPQPEAYWAALWDRFAVIASHVLSDEEVAAVDEAAANAPPVSALPDAAERALAERVLAYFGVDALPSSSSSEASPATAAPPPPIAAVRIGEDLFDAVSACEAANVRSDERERYVAQALPIGGNGRRLRLNFIALMEARYFAYETRFRVLGAFEVACRSRLSMQLDAVYRQALVGAPARMTELYDWAMATGSNILHRVLHETVWRDLCAVHLGADDMARYVLLTIESTTRATASDVVSDRPNPDDVLSRVRPTAFATANRYIENEREVSFYAIVRAEFFEHEEVQATKHTPSPAAPKCERLALLVITALMGAVLEQNDVSELDTPARNAYIDELEHKHGRDGLPFADPVEAFAKARVNAYIVRIMRRTFVVTRPRPGSREVAVVETPTFCAALLLWAAWSGVSVSSFPDAAVRYIEALRTNPASVYQQ